MQVTCLPGSVQLDIHVSSLCYDWFCPWSLLSHLLPKWVPVVWQCFNVTFIVTSLPGLILLSLLGRFCTLLSGIFSRITSEPYTGFPLLPAGLDKAQWLLMTLRNGKAAICSLREYAKIEDHWENHSGGCTFYHRVL